MVLGGRDFVSNPVNATFLAGTTNVTINIALTEDNITEEIETFNLDIILPPSTDSRINVGDRTTAIGRIIDRSSKQFIHLNVSIFKICLLYTFVALIVEFGSSEFVGSEFSQSVQVVITKANPLPTTVITVQITFSPMSATGRHIQLHYYVAKL